MGVRIGSGLSTEPDARIGAIEAATAARAMLGDERPDLAIVFASGGHLAAPEATLEGVHEALRPGQVIGCGAGGVLACGREVERGTAVAVWAAALGDGSAQTFHIALDDELDVDRMPELADGDGVVLLPDPYSFPTDALLRELAARAPGVPVLGGLSSARTLDGSPALFHDERLVVGGAVGVRFRGVELLPCVSQGAAPVGPELTITAAEGHVMRELAGKPALLKLREVFDELSETQRALVERGLLVGIVIGAGKPEYRQGDFLVRGLLSGDPETGAVTVGAPVRAGQVIRLHARDAATADSDLHEALALRMQALGGRRPAGALVFSCNGRGSAMFEHPDHDAEAVERELHGAPAAGFFAAGEIGPVGGETYLHGFTATVAVFAA